MFHKLSDKTMEWILSRLQLQSKARSPKNEWKKYYLHIPPKNWLTLRKTYHNQMNLYH